MVGKHLYRFTRDGGAEVWSLREHLPSFRQNQSVSMQGWIPAGI